MNAKILFLSLPFLLIFIGCSALEKSVDPEQYVQKVDLEVVGLKMQSDVFTYEADVDGEKSTMKDFKIDGLKLLSVFSTGKMNGIFDNSRLTIRMNIYNPNSINIVLNNFKSDVIINEKKITEITYDEGLELEKESRRDYSMTIDFPDDLDVKSILLGNEVVFKGVANISAVIAGVTSPGIDADFEEKKKLQTDQILEEFKKNNLDISKL